jgi:hypothetical protein
VRLVTLRAALIQWFVNDLCSTKLLDHRLMAEQAVRAALAAQQQQPIVAFVRLVARGAFAGGEWAVQVSLTLDVVTLAASQLGAGGAEQELRVRAMWIVARCAATAADCIVEKLLLADDQMTKRAGLDRGALLRELVLGLLGFVTRFTLAVLERRMSVADPQHALVTVRGGAIERVRHLARRLRDGRAAICRPLASTLGSV